MDNGKTCPFLPWYKEKLQTKYLKHPTNKISLVSGFITTNLDDFDECFSVLSEVQRGFSPVFFHGTPNKKTGQKPRKGISKEYACFSKQMIQKQIRREYVAAQEEKLMQHPLTKFPHYKDNMTPELFHKVASILDPGMFGNDTSGLPTPTGHHVAEEDEENCREPSEKDQ